MAGEEGDPASTANEANLGACCLLGVESGPHRRGLTPHAGLFTSPAAWSSDRPSVDPARVPLVLLAPAPAAANDETNKLTIEDLRDMLNPRDWD